MQTLKPQKQAQIDGGGVIWGLLLGLLVGGLVALFKAPIRSRAVREPVGDLVTTTRQNPHGAAETGLPSDPVAESHAQGKAAARRRRAELGLTKTES